MEGFDIDRMIGLRGWESPDVALRYTQSVKFEDSLKLYRRLEALSQKLKGLDYM